jgi:ABC-type sugar transport system ATPase subunit
MKNNYVLEVKNVYKAFGGLKALTDVSFNLRRGEIVGLVGDNAAGKSTLMKILTGLYHADQGKIFFDGREVFITKPRISKQLGIEMVYQNLELCPNLDVPANLFLGREIKMWSFLNVLRSRIMEKQSVDILHKLKIDIHNPRTRIDALSGGQQQAVSIGKAVSFDPKIILMDEPTANLAHEEVDKVLQLTILLKNHGISIIFISHRLDDVFTVSDRIYVLKHGYMVTVQEKLKTNKDEILKFMFM